MAADRSTIDSFAELFLEDAFAPAPATIQAVYDLFDPSAANVATMDEILSRVSANHRDVIPFLLMGTDARLRVLYDVVKVEDVLGPGRSALANTYVGIEGDLDTLTHAPTFVAVPPAVCGQAPEVAAPTMAHLDAVLAGEANPAGYLHPAPAAVDADHTMVTTRFLQPTTWDVAALVLASPGMERATAYQVLDGHLQALPDPDTHASTRAWLRACVYVATLCPQSRPRPFPHHPQGSGTNPPSLLPESARRPPCLTEQASTRTFCRSISQGDRTDVRTTAPSLRSTLSPKPSVSGRKRICSASELSNFVSRRASKTGYFCQLLTASDRPGA